MIEWRVEGRWCRSPKVPEKYTPSSVQPYICVCSEFMY